MISPSRHVLCVAVLLAGLAVGPSRAADPATLSRSGAPGVAACATCHGQRGEGQGNFPRLAGLDRGYLARQLDEFADGRRASVVMGPIAKALAPPDRSGLAVFFAQTSAAAAAPPARLNPNGERLALHGAWHKGVPACVQCHGPGGRGVGAAFPAIAGQRAGYIGAQLRAFKSGQRANDPLKLMRTPAAKLTDAEIDAVAQWFEAQPVHRVEAAP